MVVIEDADIESAAISAVEGGLFANGQWNTSIKKVMVHESILEKFADVVIAKSKAIRTGSCFDKSVDFSFAVFAQAAQTLEEMLDRGTKQGCKVC